MRQNRENQRPLTPVWPSHQLGQELRVISEILDQNPSISEKVLHDLCDTARQNSGAPGMSGDQVLRCAVLKQLHQFSYQQLAFHLEDSMSSRSFCRLPYGYAPGKSVLQANISRIEASTWQEVGRVLVHWAQKQGLEKGRKVRIDATTVESNIHYPTDSELLYDGMKVLTRLLEQCREWSPVVFTNHLRRGKRRLMNIRNHRGKRRVKAYRDLLKVARKTQSYAVAALQDEALAACWESGPVLDKVRHYTALLDTVIDQTQRRVLLGQKLPASEKVVSIFQEHTDIIEKGSRETVFGHKIFLSCGKSSLMLDCVVKRGNPADSELTQGMLTRQAELYGRYPRQASFDGGFASKDNLKWAKGKGIKDVAFAKKRGLKVENMVRSSWVYKQLRRFRAGIEGCISTLKRVFGLRRCGWSGWAHFQQYVQLSVVTFNLVVLARLLL